MKSSSVVLLYSKNCYGTFLDASLSLKAFHILKKTTYGTITPSKAWSRPSSFEQQTNYLLYEPCLHAGSL